MKYLEKKDILCKTEGYSFSREDAITLRLISYTYIYQEAIGARRII